MQQQEESSSRLANQVKAPGLVAFGDVLRRYRQDRKLTQEQLSWETGLDRNFISALERGVKEPGLRTILKLTHALAVPLGTFMADVEIAVQKAARLS